MTYELDHLSPSSMSMFLRCSLQWYFRYVEGIKSPPSGALLVGGSVHEAQAARLTARLNQEQELSDADTVDLAVMSFEKRMDAEEVALNEGETEAALRDETAALTATLTADVLPDIKAPDLVAVESRRDLQIEGRDVALTVIPDVEELLRIRDLKVAKRAPDPTEELQPAAYAYAVAQETGAIPLFQYDVIKKLKTGAKVDRVEYQPTAADIAFFWRVFDGITDAIAAGAFVPRPVGWHCTERFCGYWKICRGGEMF